MKKVTIDCAGIDSPGQLHQALQDALAFPEWYGRNLDALHDCLCALTEETELTVMGLSRLGRYEVGFRRVLADSQQENPLLKVVII